MSCKTSKYLSRKNNEKVIFKVGGDFQNGEFYFSSSEILARVFL
jgi:hypothetical protein